MEPLKESVLNRVLSEIFWGDYRINAQTAQKKLEEGDADFIHFLVGRIVADSPSPTCRLLSLFSPEKALELLSSIKTTGRAEKRRSLALAIISNTPWEHEPQWLRNPII